MSLLLYGVASFVHFAHNAENLAAYPNLPAWLSRAGVYAAWCGITMLGLSAYVLRRRGYEWAGLALLAVYAALGFDGLLHYGRAPMHVHTAAMNSTIWFEVCTAGLAFAAVMISAVKLH